MVKENRYKRFKKALIEDLDEIRGFSNFRMDFMLGYIEGCWNFLDFSEDERDKLKSIIIQHVRNYNWLGRLKKEVSH